MAAAFADNRGIGHLERRKSEWFQGCSAGALLESFARMKPVRLLPLLLLLAGCAVDTARGPLPDDPELGFDEGAPSDDGPAFDAMGGKADLGYTRPTDLPELVAPEVRISLEGFTTHLFDRATGFSAVYEVGLGRLGSSGFSHTPVGHYATGGDPTNAWWNIDARWSPEYYMGLPFVRITKTNRDGNYTYGLHGPITDPLQVGYVSGGCVRMQPDDIIELYWILKEHPGSPVSIQQEIEFDAEGEPVEAGRTAALFDPDAEITYGESLGPRVTGFTGDTCETDDECGDFYGGEGSFCHPAGFCTQPCAGSCADLDGKAPTFCARDSDDSGICVPVANDVNGDCAVVPGTAPEAVSRYVGDSGASAATRMVCSPSAT
jgi:hypothetical protein